MNELHELFVNAFKTYLGGRMEERMSSVAVGFVPFSGVGATFFGDFSGDFKPLVSVLLTQTGFSYFTRENAPDILN